MAHGKHSNSIMGTVDWTDPVDVGNAINWLWDRRTLKDSLEQRAARNISFLEGRQWYEWDWRQRQMRLPDRYRGQYQLVFNQIKPLIFAKLAKLTRREPVWTVPAYTSDEFDQMVARYSNDLLGWYWNYGLNMSEKLSELLLWYFCSPAVWVHPTWNPTKGDPVEFTFDDFRRPPMEGASHKDQEGAANEDLDKYRGLRGYSGDDYPIVTHTGDIDFEVASIFKMMWYPFHVETWDQVHVYLKTDVMAPEEVAQRYQIPLKEVLQSSRPAEMHTHYEKILTGWSSPYLSQPQSMPPEYDRGTLVHQIYADRIAAPPWGAQGVMLGATGKAIPHTLGKLDNAMGVLPFRGLVENQTPGFAWGTCSIDDTICAQVDQNLTRTQQAKWRNQLVRPQIIRIKGDGAKDDAFRKQETIIEVQDKAHIPAPLYIPSSGIEHQETTAWNSRYIHDAIGIPDVSLGRTGNTQARSGRAVLALQEESHERMKLNGDALNQTMSWVGQFFLSELQLKAVAERITPLVGEANQVEFRAWSRASLRPSIYERDPSKSAIVTVNTFSNIPTTVAQSRQLIMELTETGYLRPGVHDRLVAQVFGMNDFRAVLDRGRADRDKQETEIARWRQGMQVMPPSITDEDEQHIEILADWIKTEEFSQLSVTIPGLGQQVIDHFESHQQAVHDKKARTVFRDQFAQFRIGAEFAMRSMKAGRSDWAQAFLMQAYGAPGGQPAQGDPNDQNARGPQPNQQSNSTAVGGAPPGSDQGGPGEKPNAVQMQDQQQRAHNPDLQTIQNKERVLNTGQM